MIPRRSLALSTCLLLAACGGAGNTTPAKAGGPRAFPVLLAPIATAEVTYVVRAPGTVTAFETVQVPARVAGVAETVSFREGETVTSDTVLVEVDAERYRLRAALAAAQLAALTAEQQEADSGLKRRRELSAGGTLTADELATWEARAAAAAARTTEAKAAFDLAEIDRRQSLVRSPLAGVVQSRLVQTGQRIDAGQAVAVLLRRDPLQVRFSVSADEAARLTTGMPVDLRVGSLPAKATLSFLAASADVATRQVQCLADVATADAQSLRPGAFAEVEIKVSSATRPAVPYAAIRPSDEGFLAFVVVDDKAVRRVVRIGLRTADGRVEVLEGLTAGEHLVVRGGEALRDGSAVENRDPAAAKPAAKPADAK